MEQIAATITLFISHGLEIIAALFITAAVFKLLYQWFRSLLLPEYKLPAAAARIEFGSAVAVSLELLLAADVLATAVAPSWDDIGKLAAIAALRTALNYFLGRELKESKTAA